MASLLRRSRSALQAVYARNSAARFSRFARFTSVHTSAQSVAEASNERNVVVSRHQDCFIPNMTVAQRIFERSQAWPDKTAIVCGFTGRSYTYDQLTRLSRNFGGSLVKMGFRKGDVIAVMLPNIPEFAIAFFGAAGIGMIVCPMNPTYTYEEMVRLLQLCQASAVVTFPAVTGTVREALALCPSVKRSIVVGHPEEGFVSMEDMLRGNGHLFPDDIDVNLQDDTLVLPFSSGTTGLPKGVVLTNYSVNVNVQQLLHPGTTNLQETNGSFQETYICILPFFHIYGISALMTAGLDHGAKLVTLPRFQPESFLEAIHKYQPTQLYLVPPLVNLLASHPGLDANALDRLHTVSSGAAPLSDAIAQKFHQRFSHLNTTLQEGYGLTETSGPTHLCPLVNAKIGSVGQLISRTKAKVVHVETGQSLGPGEHGELCIFGPQIMKGYKDNPTATSSAFDSSGWLRTGDIAYYDRDEQFFIVGRLKELIKVKGMQVSPSELENLLCQHEDIADAAVVGIPDEIHGEVPCAFVVRKTSGKELDTNEVLRFVESRVASYKKLKGGVYVIDSIPKSPTGKILRNQLKEMALSESKKKDQ